MTNSENKIYTVEDFRKWGSIGGKITVKKMGKRKMREFGKKGGLVRKLQALEKKLDNTRG